MEKTFDPRHLDLKAFAQAGGELAGEGLLTDFERLQQEQWGGDQPETVVHWQLQGRLIPVTGGPSQVGLALQARVRLALQCQRCLSPVVEELLAKRDFLFVADESTAEALDEESEADVLVLSRDFDALSLVEDELILALPLVPRHAVCPQALPQAPADMTLEASTGRPHPFAALAALKKSG